MVSLGSPAPDFTAETSQRTKFTLSSLKGKLIALYFYPKAMTAGCTMETKGFQAVYPEILALGGEVVGVSHDVLDDQCRFAEKLQVSFRLVADPQRVIIDAYGVGWPLIRMAKRVTFIIDKQFNISSFHQHELLIGRHAEDVLKAFKHLQHHAGKA